MAESQQRAGIPARDTQTDRALDVDVDLEGNSLHVEATIVKTKTVDVAELFTETPDDAHAERRLKISEDPGFGWDGFEIRDGELYRVNYQQLEGGSGEYLEERRVDRDELVRVVRDVIEDDDVGLGYGDFAARRPGAGF